MNEFRKIKLAGTETPGDPAGDSAKKQRPGRSNRHGCGNSFRPRGGLIGVGQVVERQLAFVDFADGRLDVDAVLVDQGVEFDEGLVESLVPLRLRPEGVADTEVESHLVDVAVVHAEDLAEEVHRLPLLGTTKDDRLTLGDAELVLSQQAGIVEGELDNVLICSVQVRSAAVLVFWAFCGSRRQPRQGGVVGGDVGVGVAVVVPCHAGPHDGAGATAVEDLDSGSVSAGL
ncbi:hypothetical protein SIM91_05865 [Rhodococcus opacus]|uniref:hypothetical protein n=1 Tax=Rhodococcus opacus TaxID=37919 RepID=UPI0029C4C70A|nr:hypothetical protein [Rhodococcus opacus]MDX5962841.1 hypothetical protein [Rhodococcus opacus]